MRPVSAAFLRAVTGSHPAIFRATVCSSFQTTTTPTGTRIPILGGDVKVDGTANVRSTLDLSTDGTGKWPRYAADLLAPYGNEIYIERGIAYSDASVEYVGLGYFRIDTVEQPDPPSGAIRVAGSDRMAGIIDAGLLQPLQFAVGRTLSSIVNTLIFDVYPNATVVWPDGGDTTVITRALITTEDRFAFLDDLIRAQGKTWYWDYKGQLVIRNIPNPTTPVFDVQAGQGGVLLGSNRQLTRAGVYNAVVASGQGADTNTPVRGTAIDAGSPTRWAGPFGKSVLYYTSSFIGDNLQAKAAAQAQLLQNLGLPYKVDLSLSPNPALEPYDPIRVRHAASEGVELHILDSLTIPLTAGAAMSATTRQQSKILLGSI